MNQLFIICHTWRDTDMTIETFRTREKALKYLSELVGDHFRKPDPLESVEEFVSEYNEAQEEEGYENFCITTKIEEL